MDNKARDEALALTLREKFVYVTTIDETGFPETRVMFNLLKTRGKALSSGPAKVPVDFASYLGTNTSSRNIGQIRRDNRVCLYYSDNRGFYGCMVRGRVTEVTDPAIRKAIWVPAWNMYYSGGIDGGDFSVLLFTPESVRYYHGLKVHDFGA
jgi:general stress protein 26